MLQYAGPGEIRESLSNNGTAWRIWWNGKHYNRNIMHLNPYTPDLQVIEEQRAVQDNSITVNSYIAALDGAEHDNYHIAQVIDITDDLLTLHYMGTGSNNLRSAIMEIHVPQPQRCGSEILQPKHDDC